MSNDEPDRPRPGPDGRRADGGPDPGRPTIRVLIVDGHEVSRRGHRVALSAEHDIDVVGEAAAGAVAVDLAGRLRPDVVLVDVRTSEVDGLATARVLVARPDPPWIIMVTTSDPDEYVYEAARAGVAGFHVEHDGPRLLVEAVRAALNGGRHVPPSVLPHLLHRFADHVPGPTPLTAREMDIVRAVARGGTNTEIAAELRLSLSTVKSHLASVQTKLRTRNRVEVAAWAWANGHVR